MKITIYKSKKNIAGEYSATIDFLNTQVQVISDNKRERDLIISTIKKSIKNLNQ